MQEPLFSYGLHQEFLDAASESYCQISITQTITGRHDGWTDGQIVVIIDCIERCAYADTVVLNVRFLCAEHDRATTIATLQQLVEKLPSARHRMLKLLMQHLYK